MAVFVRTLSELQLPPTSLSEAWRSLAHGNGESRCMQEATGCNDVTSQRHSRPGWGQGWQNLNSSPVDTDCLPIGYSSRGPGGTLIGAAHVT